MDKDKVDPVVKDLAQRILSRELFKIVPVSSERVEEFLQQEGAYEKIYSVMKPFCPGDPRDYLVRDDYSKSFFNKDASGEPREAASSYLVDNTRAAKPLHSHPDLASHKWGIKATRLFTLETCVQEVRNAIVKR